MPAQEVNHMSWQRVETFANISHNTRPLFMEVLGMFDCSARALHTWTVDWLGMLPIKPGGATLWSHFRICRVLMEL